MSQYKKALRAVSDTVPGISGDSERLGDLAKDTQEVAALGIELRLIRPRDPAMMLCSADPELWVEFTFWFWSHMPLYHSSLPLSLP